MKDFATNRRQPHKRTALPLRPLTNLRQLRPYQSSASGAVDMEQRDNTDGQGASYQRDLMILSPDDLPFVDDNALYDPCIRTMSCKLDPFSAASVPIDTTARGLLEYFTFYTSNSPSTWTYNHPSSVSHVPHTLNPSAMQPPATASSFVSCAFVTPSGTLLSSSVSPTTSNVPDQVLESALQDALVMTCLLATAAARMYYVEHVQLARWRKAELRFTQQALHLLKSRIGDIQLQCSAFLSTSMEGLVGGMLHLAGAAFYKGDLSTANVHIKAAVEAMNLNGGTSKLTDPYIQGRLLS